MIKVSSKEEAWALVNRLFPSEYQMDERRSEFAGYPVYYSTKEGEDAWISDLGCRLEVTYPDGDSETVWINAPDDVVTTLGFVKERKVFPSVTIQEVEEKCLLNLRGLTFGEEAGKPAVKFWTSDEEGTVYFCDEVAYVQIGDVKKDESLTTESATDNNDLVVQFATLWGMDIGSASSSKEVEIANEMKQWNSDELYRLFSEWKDEYLSQDEIEDSVEFFRSKVTNWFYLTKKVENLSMLGKKMRGSCIE